MIKVLFFPLSDKNPYQRLLANSLEDLDILVIFDKSELYLRKLVLKKPSFQILHLHWLPKDFPRKILMVFKLVLLRLRGIKIILTVHNIFPHNVGKPIFTEVFFHWFVAHIADLLIVHCKSAKNSVVSTYKVTEEKISITHHGNYINWYPNNITKQSARAALKLPQDKFIFLSFGMISEYKGVENILNLFGPLKDKAVLLLAGQPKDEKYGRRITKMASEYNNIYIFPEFVENRKVQLFFNASDCVLLPYLDVLTSGVVILSMSFGRPVVAPKIGCITEYLSEQVDLLYDSSSREGLTKTIDKVLSMKDLSLYGHENLEKSKELTWEKTAIQTKLIYEEAIRK